MGTNRKDHFRCLGATSELLEKALGGLNKLVVLACLGTFCFGTSPALAESLKFESYEPGDHQGIFSGAWNVGAFSAKADLTQASQANAPLVVYNPGWGGSKKYLPAFKDIQSRLGKGYHHLFLSHSDDVDLAGRTITIYQAIRAAQEKGISPSKIVVVGASGGGQEAIHATHSRTASSLSGGIKIDGVVAFYPSCRVGFEDKNFDDARVLIFVGAKDKVSPGVLCRELKENGGLGHAELIEFSAAGHSWLMTKRAATKKQRTWGECRINIDQTGVWHGEGFDSKNGIGKLLKGMGKKCAKKINMVVGRNSSVYDESVSATIDFIKGL